MLDLSNVPAKVTLKNTSKSKRKVSIARTNQTFILEAKGGAISVKAADTPELLAYLCQGNNGVEVTATGYSGGGGGDFPEAPFDGKAYGRKDGSWVKVVTDLSFEELQTVVANKATISDIGYLVVKTIQERDSIPAALKEGTCCYVSDLDATYRRRNGNWVQLSSSGVEIASKTKAGIVMIGDYLLVNENGLITLDLAEEVKEGDKRPVTSDAVYKHVDHQIVGPILTELSSI